MQTWRIEKLNRIQNYYFFNLFFFNSTILDRIHKILKKGIIRILVLSHKGHWGRP